MHVLQLACPAVGRAQTPPLHTAPQLARCFNCNPNATRLLAVPQHVQHTIAPCHSR